jgi:hypothetical protein
MNNPNIQTAIPQNPLESKEFFVTSNLSFISTCLLLDKGILISRCVLDPRRVDGVKLFFLSPKTEVEKIWREFTSDLIKLSPQLVSEKIAAVRQFPAERTENPIKPPENPVYYENPFRKGGG